jgi:ATP adenylyltransferase
MKKKVSKTKAKATKSSKKVSLQSVKLGLGKDIWPLERDVLFRPDRYKYIRKLIPTNGCVFCESEKAGIRVESLVVFQSKYSQVVLNKFPYNSGHILVMPRRHCGDLLKLSAKEYQDLMDLLRKSFEVIEQAYSPGGINMGLNHGAVAGAGIPEHLHFHVIPRWSGDLNFFPLIAESKVVIESLDITFQKLAKFFK